MADRNLLRLPFTPDTGGAAGVAHVIPDKGSPIALPRVLRGRRWNSRPGFHHKVCRRVGRFPLQARLAELDAVGMRRGIPLVMGMDPQARDAGGFPLRKE